VIGWLLVAQLAVVASGPDTATACDTIKVSVAAQADGSVAPRIVLPLGRAFQLLRTDLVTRIEPDGMGRTLAIAEATYLIATSTIGRVVVPAAVATLGAHRAVALPIAIDVHADDAPAPVVLVRSSLDDGRRRGANDTLFVGQQVDYVVDVQLNEAARQRLRRNPTFFPPEMPAVLAYDLPAPQSVQRTGQQCFATLSYRRALFPLFPGSTTIPPATLAYGLPVSTSFFSREERFEQRTDSVRFLAVEPPTAGRPDDYAGAVGSVRIAARLGSASARMGDPLVLTVRLEGKGNVKLLPRPALTLDWASIANGEERVEVDTTRSRVQGAKEFDWLLTPRHAGPQEVPGIRYPYFDPERPAYDVAVSGPISLDIAAASLATADTLVAPRLAIRTTLREERPPALPSRPWFWLLLIAAPVPATLRRLVRRRRRRKSGLAPGRRLQQLAAARTQLPARELRRLFLDALRERIPTLTLATSQSPLWRQLRRAGVTEVTAEVAEALLARLDRAAFSATGSSDARLTVEAAAVARAVDDEAVRPRPRSGSALLLIALLLGGSTLLAIPESAARTFDEGVRAYERNQPLAAERLFARTAARVPRAADAWANFGTAAWTANDSARAALGWQRALRLDPLDAESRERLLGVAPIAIDAPGYVPPLPVDALAGGALALWALAWLALALPPSRRPVALRGVGGGAIVVAVVVLLGALEIEQRLEPRGLAVLRGSLTLLEDPSPAGAPRGGGMVGEVGRLGAREGAWVRIILDGARAGWIPVAGIIPLDGPSPAD
jgi:tetratricopeptide (TPR) repeat protein